VHNSNLVPDTDYSDCAFLWVSSDHPCRFRSSTYCFLPRPSRLIRPACHRISYSTLCSPSYRTVMLHGLHKYRNPHRPLQSNTQHFCFLLMEVPRSHLGLETGERILREVSPLPLSSVGAGNYSFKLNHDEFHSVPVLCCLIVPPFYATTEQLTVSLNNRK